MIRHIVLLKICENSSPEERSDTALKILEKTDALKESVPQIRETSSGVNMNEKGFHVCIESVFESKEALREYLIHPEHKKTAAYINSVSYELSVFDYEF